MAKNKRLRRRNERLLKRVWAPELVKAKRTTRPQDAKGLRAALVEAEQQQAATSEILRVISSSPTDVQPVFDAIAHSAARLFDVRTTLILARGDRLEIGAMAGYDEKSVRQLHEVFPRPIDRETTAGRTVLDRAGQHIPDVDAPEIPEVLRRTSHATGVRALLSAPMLREGAAIGAILLTRATPGLFSEKQAALLQTFARQAVIAIENVRLFNETKQALERQTATSEILRVISSSPAELQPVFDTIARNFTSLCGAAFATVFTYDGELVHYGGGAGFAPERERGHRAKYPVRVTDPSVVSARTIFTRAVVHVHDVLSDPDYDARRAAMLGVRRILGMPMLRDGVPLGAIVAGWEEPGVTPKHHEDVLNTFADQAVIAIENVRLFNETREALEQQTAISEVLRVISNSPTDVKPVLEAVAARAARICEATDARIFLAEGDRLRLTAGFGDVPTQVKVAETIPVEGSVTGCAVSERRAVHIEDLAAISPDQYPYTRRLRDIGGYHTVLAVPLLREKQALGGILLRRMEVRPFTDKQIQLVKTFADQAAIAIENVRLFNETKEALERQTATSDILRVISRTTTDTQPVFEAIVESGLRVLPDTTLAIAVVEQDAVRVVATGGYLRGALGLTVPPGRESATGTAIADRRLVHLPDIEAPDVPPLARENGRRLGYRSMAVAPMLREDRVIGAVAVMLKSTGGLSEKQLNLLKTFADQAVIAIENVRLFNETKEALERQTATSEILKVISSSPTDTQPVFDVITRSGKRLFDGLNVAILLRQESQFVLAGYSGPGMEDLPDQVRTVPLDREKNFPSRAILDGRVLQITDWEGDDVPEHEKIVAKAFGIRSGLMVPLLRKGEGIGAIALAREMAGPFHEKDIALLQSFADQAVIAIENVRLFKELEARTGALSRSVGQLTALGEVGQAISSTLELETVLKTIVSRAVQLTGLDGGSIYEYDERAEEFRLQAAENMAQNIAEDIRKAPTRKGDGALGRTAITREPTQVPDTLDDSYQSGRKELLIRAGYRALLAVPLLREDHLLGGLLVNRKTPGPFAPEIVELLKTFATQSAMAIQNARLFREIADKGRQLEVASRHKSDFLASMSHELRTPLNAILGFNEMILGQVYGEVPADMQDPLTDIQTSGKHLLRLINNVLDLAKIEAGRMELSLADYSVHATVESVRSTLRPLAADRGLEFLATVPADVPLAHGDAGRITQCLMNLAGNSLKFTKAGKVEISVELKDSILVYRVTDTGIGIAPDKIETVFAEFKQSDATIASEYGGTGLGLSISRKFIEMHGGRIWVESELGKGSSFIFEIPLRVSGGAPA